MKFGLYKSPLDTRDFVVSSFLKREVIPPEMDLTEEMSPVRNQGNEGSCVGFAMVSGVKEFQEKKDYKLFIGLSPRFLYENAKKISGHSEGTTLKAAVEVALKMGVCEERLWKYEPQKPGKPSDIAYDNAKRFRISAYARITNLEELKRAICNPNIGASLIGVTVYKGMMSDECKRTGVVPNPSCFEKMKALGGHALCAVGYRDKSPYFKDGHIKCKNSWGDFGDNGYIYLSYTYIKNNMIDAFSSIDIDDPLPYRVLTVKNITGEGRIWI